MKWLLVICIALASACKDREVEELSSVRDVVCACKTVKCAESALGGVPKGTVESTPRSQAIAREMLNCLAELYEQGRPTMDPDAELPLP